MARKYDIGDVHAKVEDTEVPLGLKVLVILLFLMLLALIIGIALSAGAPV